MTVKKELIHTYLAGLATPIQKKMIAEWLEQPANQELYFQWIEEWERQTPQYVPNMEAATERFQQRLDAMNSGKPTVENTLVNEPIEPRSWFRFPWTWAASAILIIGLVGYLASDLIRYKTYETNYGQTYTFKLSDGSSVTLNGHSELKVPRFGFGKSTRNVTLNGEAVFDVKHTQTNQRFVVQTPKKLEIEVLGTEFSVTARPQATQVALNRGKVKLHYQATNQQRHQLVMKPGDWVTLSQQGNMKRGRHKDPQAFAAWRDQRFVFDNTPLREVVAMLNDTYGMKVELSDDELALRTLTGTFRARTADALLEALAELLELRITHPGRSIVLSSKTTTS
ncbi:FecR family protein [Tellurirhabdus bombi]|uniref:FecR family protein n=1 Tax=Tellurirhabdus bombi TaxID=2907205 RepID=UPI001F47BC4A|nr:FecR domain-containing protein [Tellurirhabdus bombi]